MKNGSQNLLFLLSEKTILLSITTLFQGKSVLLVEYLDWVSWGAYLPKYIVAYTVFSFFFFLLRGFCYRARALARQPERDIETESEKSPPRGDDHATIPSPLFSRDLGHAHTCAWCEF